MTTEPVYAVLGEPYLPGMVLPPTAQYGYGIVAVDDVEARHFIAFENGFATLSRYESWVRQGYVPYVHDNEYGDYTYGKSVGYLGYDGSLHDGTVNQVPVGRVWKKALGTFAHHIASFSDRWHMMREPGFYNSGHSFVHTDESNMRNRVTVWWGIGVCGEAYRLVDEWMALDPVPDPTLHADLNWRIGQATLEDMMADICNNCLGDNILRRFNRRVQALNYQTALNSGLVVLPNFDEATWGPRFVLRRFTHLGTSARSDIWDELALWCDKAVEYYDENIAVNAIHF